MPAKKSSAKARKPSKTASRKAAKPASRKAASSRTTAARAAPKAQRKAKAAAPPARTRKAAAKPKKAKPTAPTKKAVSPRKRPSAARKEPEREPVMIVAPEPLPGEGEEGEIELAGANLLAGPRNVQPYIPQRGEQYMSQEQLDHFRQILSSWKRDLMEEVDRTVLHMKDEAANFPDPNDRATQESEFSLELRTRDRERKLIRKIDEALKRIDDGTYGYCLETGEEIGIKRLEARPVATLCVEAQERRERREKQYGDRDDRYR